MRVIEQSDSQLLADIHTSSFNNHWHEPQFKALLNSGAKGWLIEEATFILTRSAADEVEILTLATHPKHRQKGYAKDMVNHCITTFKAQKYSVIFLEVRDDNLIAQTLYQALGFQQTATRKSYYAMPDGTRKDAIIMRLSLDKS